MSRGGKNHINFICTKIKQSILGFLGAHCSIELSPKQDWLRPQRRHYPLIFNRSNIRFEPEPVKPTSRFNAGFSLRDEKRHFCNVNTRSYLDDYF